MGIKDYGIKNGRDGEALGARDEHNISPVLLNNYSVLKLFLKCPYYSLLFPLFLSDRKCYFGFSTYIRKNNKKILSAAPLVSANSHARELCYRC